MILKMKKTNGDIVFQSPDSVTFDGSGVRWQFANLREGDFLYSELTRAQVFTEAGTILKEFS